MKTDSAFTVRNKQQIINHLTLLMRQKCLFNLHFGENESFITTLLAIDPSKDRILLDCGPKEYLNKKLLSTPTIVFRASYAGIKVAFEGTNIKSVDHDGHTAFSIPIPENLLWRQRRQYYRVKSPLSKNSYLRLSIDEEPPAKLQLYDISISGFSVLNEFTVHAELLIPGKEFLDCRLILDSTGEDVIAFKVQNVIPVNPSKPDKTQKIGCQFTAISPAFESSIQRYMQQIERENKQKS
ncbi:MAG: flagellar brake protein [Gammaproteobacteria bacterium]